MIFRHGLKINVGIWLKTEYIHENVLSNRIKPIKTKSKANTLRKSVEMLLIKSYPALEEGI